MARTKGTAYVTVVYTQNGNIVSKTVNNEAALNETLSEITSNGGEAIVVKGRVVNKFTSLKQAMAM